MQIKEIMSRDVVCVQANNTLREALNIMQENNRTKLPVLSDNKVVGMIVRYDIEQGTRQPGVIWETPVEWIMTKKPLMLTPDYDVIEAAKHFVNNKIGGMPVIENEKIVGFVSKNDIINLFIKLVEEGQCKF